MGAEYHFVTDWHIRGTASEVAAVLPWSETNASAKPARTSASR